jgi:arabinogalactan oligomer/maltooligosaccharide transport system substrate-binding protein
VFNKRKLCLLLLPLFLLSACAAGGGNGPDGDTVYLKVWAPAEEQEILVDMCNAFKEAHPEYNLSFSYAVMSVDDTINSMKKDADVAADVFLYPSGGIAELTEAGLILPITLRIDELRAEHSDNAIAACSLNGMLYGVPVTPNTWILYYNKSMYTEEDVRSLETMLSKDLGAGVYNFSCRLKDSWYLSAFFFANGCTLFGEAGDDPSSCTFNDASGLQVGQYLLDLAANPAYVEDADGLAGSLMARGQLGALCSGTWSALSLQEALGEDYGAAKLPTIRINGVDRQLRPFVDYKAFGVNSATKHPKEAIELAIWLGGAQSQMIRFETTGAAPTISALLAHPAVASRPEVVALIEQEPLSQRQPTVSKLSDFWTPCEAFGFELVEGTVNAGNLQSKLDDMVRGILSSLGP